MQKANKVKTITLGLNNTVVNANTTAMHVAHAMYNAYCNALENANFKNEFSICDGGDFAMYNVYDLHCIIKALYNAFDSVQTLLQNDSNATLQQAYSTAHNAANTAKYDTIVAEEIQFYINDSIVTASKSKTVASNIAADLAYS